MTAAGSRQIELTAADWLARREGGDWSPDDGARLDAWLAGATAHRVAFLRLEAAWVESGRLRDGPDLRVVVTEGLVRLESEPSQGQPAVPTTLLPAGSSAHATRSGVMVRAGTVAEAERALDWRSGFLHFDDTPLAEAAAEFNRYSGRTVLMGDDATAALRIGGNVRWSNVDGFVRRLEQGFDVRAERRGEIIILHSGVANSLERPGNAP